MYQADQKHLIALPDQQCLTDKVTDILIECEQNNLRAAVLFINLDRFLKTSDTHSRAMSSKLLIAAVQRIQSCLQEKDFVTRYSEDEFIAIIPFKNQHTIENKVSEIISKLTKIFYVHHTVQYIGASAGISIFPSDGHLCDALIKKASIAMDEAKQNERGRYVHFSPHMQAVINNKVALEADLFQAIMHKELYLVYQPQIDLSTGIISGVETLVRWQHPKRGNISPEKFISYAEDNEFIITLGSWIIREAIKQCATWQKQQTATRIAINISVKQLRHHAFLAELRDMLNTYSIDPQLIEFEITEGLFLGDDKEISQLLKAINDLGIALAIDDFGTGYSSLTRLKSIPVKTFKLDRTFIQNIVTDENSLAIVKAMIAMGKELDKVIIAEGVESFEQYHILKALNCDHAQGYYFSHPTSAEEAVAMFNTPSIAI